jgi:hypothetical protein
MAQYKVLVPFASVIFESMSQQHTTRLAPRFSLEEISVNEERSHFYIAEIKVEAKNHLEAKIYAVNRIEEVLGLFAVCNDGFRIVISGVMVEKKNEEVPSKNIIKKEVDGERNNISVTDVIEIGEHISTLITKGNYEFEANAIKCRGQWPDWLRIALKLNYLAVVSHDLIISLMLRFSALEVLEYSIMGEPVKIIKLKFKEKEKRDFFCSVRRVFDHYELSQNEIERIEGRIRDTNRESKTNRLAKALKICGVSADPKDIRFVIERRGAVTHKREQTESGDIEKALAYINNWISKALHFILRNQKYVFDKCDNYDN